MYCVVSTSCENKYKNPFMRANTGFALGTTYSIQYEIFDEKGDYKNDIENVFFEVNKSISAYISTSDISRINKGEKEVVIDDYFKTVYNFSREVYEKKDGYYDPSVDALVNVLGIWSRGTRKHSNI